MSTKYYMVESKTNIRGDYLFSYWILLWFFIYYFSKCSQCGNPIVALIAALIENIITFIYLVISGTDLEILIKFLLMMLLIKIAPLWMLRNSKINWINSALSFIIVFSAYNVYLWLNQTNLIEIYKRTFQSIHSNSNRTPLFSVLSKFNASFA
jgi:hypothetical protein